MGVTNKLAIKEVNAEHLFPIVALAFGQDADFNLITDIAKDSDSRAKQIYEVSDVRTTSTPSLRAQMLS